MRMVCVHTVERCAFMCVWWSAGYVSHLFPLQVYPEDPAEYTPPTAEQLAKNRTEKKQKEVHKRQKVMESRERLALVR